MLLALTAFALSACAPLITQNPGGAISAANVVELDGDNCVMLKGADVVAYFKQSAYVQDKTSRKIGNTPICSNLQIGSIP